MITVAQMVAAVNPDLVGNHVTVAQPGMFSVDVQTHKEAQNALIQENHPKEEWDNQTWIESADDIKTFDEAMEAVRADMEQRTRQQAEGQPRSTGPPEGRAATDRYGNVVVDEDVSPESVRAKLQDIFNKKDYNKREVFPILKHTPQVYTEY